MSKPFIRKKTMSDHYPYLVKKLREDFIFTNEQTEIIIDIIMNTCPECWEAPVGCQCWNDE